MVAWQLIGGRISASVVLLLELNKRGVRMPRCSWYPRSVTSCCECWVSTGYKAIADSSAGAPVAVTDAGTAGGAGYCRAVR